MDVISQLNFTVKLSDREWRLITKGLALLAGLKVTTTPEEREASKALNATMLGQRKEILAAQLRIATAAHDHATEETPTTE